jgi:tryptophan halogenase
MKPSKVQKVVILGGGTAGWMTAALLGKVLGKSLDIELVESDKISTIGVGEASIPPIANFNQAIGVDEKAFIKATKGTIKLGIEFSQWNKANESYMHAFGSIGKNFPFCDFHHFWLKHQQQNSVSQPLNKHSYWSYSLNYQAAKQNKFAPVKTIPNTNLPGMAYAYHFDAGLYANFLRQHAQGLGVIRTEGIVTDIQVNQDNGYIKQLLMDNGQVISGDLFIDCSGLSALLIEKTLNTGYEDWSHWLPCNSAVAVPSENVGSIEPYTRSTAQTVGWQWRIPLQHRTGNGLVYSDKYLSDEQAKACLLSNIDGKALAEPRVIKFRTGRRRKVWHKNVVSIGLSSGFLEPLESTNIHLVQTAATRLVKFFPHQGISTHQVDTFNRLSQKESEGIRDFIILHYKLNQRQNSEFWQACQRMEIPASLQQKIALFVDTGKVHCEPDELFTEIAWQQVMIGQDAIPSDYHGLVDGLTTEQLNDLMQSLQTLITKTVEKLPSHDDYLANMNSQ